MFIDFTSGFYLILLALLYQEAGEEKQARESLSEAKQLAESYGSPFEAQDLLDELQLIKPQKEK